MWGADAIGGNDRPREHWPIHAWPLLMLVNQASRARMFAGVGCELLAGGCIMRF